jgi:hypothetical protein
VSKISEIIARNELRFDEMIIISALH